jgi:hypothetical protein
MGGSAEDESPNLLPASQRCGDELGHRVPIYGGHTMRAYFSAAGAAFALIAVWAALTQLVA